MFAALITPFLGFLSCGRTVKGVLKRLTAVTRIPGVWLLLALCVAYAPLFTGRIVFFRDPAFWNFPARFFVSRALRQGHFPSWNPNEGLGFSVWANPLYGLLYPPNWLFVLVPDNWVASLCTWQSFAHNFWGGLGIIFIARRFGCTGASCFIGGVAWALCGYTTSMWSAGLLLLAGSWVPWCAVGFLSLHAELKRPGGNWAWGVVKAAAPVAMSLLMGEVFVAMMGVAFGAATLVALCASEEKWQGDGRQQSRLRLAGLVTLACALGAAIGAIVIVPAATALGSTDRAAPMTREVAEMYSVHPLRLLEFAIPGALGDPYNGYEAGAVVGEKRIDWRPLAFGSYFGASVMLLALWGLERKRKYVWLIATFALLSLLVSFGKHLPLHAALRTVIVPMARMRYPEKYLAMFTCWFALLAAFGAHRVQTARGPFILRRAAAWLVVLAGGAALATQLLPAPWAACVRSGIVASLASTAMCLAVVAGIGRRYAVLAPILIGLIVTVDLTLPLWELQPFSSDAVANGVPPAAKQILAENKGALGSPRVYRADTVEAMMAQSQDEATVPQVVSRSALTLVPNLNTAYGLAAVPGYDAAIPTEFMKLWSLAKTRALRALRLFATGYAIMPGGPMQATMRREAFAPIMDPYPGVRLFRVFEPNPPGPIGRRCAHHAG